ncbi:alpha-2,8-sialyltransferase 8F-like isoform X2 [Acanthaster planci]|uniref:Alpha-2,8-sialyltransferase 8F-like isoform X2 n=1 Tax=Acanthaster planci TaxID=133434 RepID=A0A8B7YKK4_ACAPL|nr:alpha-2,8-sialyltransferase 8F-like isoform X2 [Acanthaster planci]
MACEACGRYFGRSRCISYCWQSHCRRALLRRFFPGVAILAVVVLFLTISILKNLVLDTRCKSALDVDHDSEDRTNKTPQVIALRIFSERYRHLFKENTEMFFKHLRRLTETEWKPHNKTICDFRDSLRAVLGEEGSIRNFLLTKTNVPRDSRMCFYMYGNIQAFPPALWECLPKNEIYKPGQFASCSVVGSSGILRGSRCGKEIDQPQAVFRLNSLKTQDDQTRFGNVLEQFKDSYLWLPAFSVAADISIVTQTAQFAVNSKIVWPILGHPEHFLSVSTMWRTMSKTKHTWASSGLYLILSLVDVCDRIHVFGFWPYTTTINGSDVPYHYHNDISAMTNVHNFDTEFKSLVHLYEQGIINMHLGPCI